MKTHLRRMAGPRKFTYEELATLLVDIELVFNSQPLGSAFGDIDDLDILTPDHFLIGAPLLAPPQPYDADANLDHTAHWQLVKRMRDHFWVRWSREYFNTLQQRWKWSRPRDNATVGDVVMIIDLSLLRGHGRWPLGRVRAVHPGPDQRVQVIEVRTAMGDYVRPITRIVRLPVSSASPSGSPD